MTKKPTKKLTKKPQIKCCSVHMVQKDPEFFDEKTPDEKTREKTLVNVASHFIEFVKKYLFSASHILRLLFLG